MLEVQLADANGWTGATARVFNNFWPHHEGDAWDPNGASYCLIVGRCSCPYSFAGVAAPAYIIAYDGVNYPIKESALRSLSKHTAQGAPIRSTAPRRR